MMLLFMIFVYVAFTGLLVIPFPSLFVGSWTTPAGGNGKFKGRY